MKTFWVLEPGRFYFIEADFFQRYADFFPDLDLKKYDRRPFFFAFREPHPSKLLWMIPISSKHDKYQAVFDSKVARYGFCDTIRFGRVEGLHTVFLIQNMFPVTREYIREVYLDRFSHFVRATPIVRNDVIRSAKSVLHKVQSSGLNLTFVDVLKLRSQLLEPERGISTPSLAAQLAAATERAEAQQPEYQTPVQQREDPSLDR